MKAFTDPQVFARVKRLPLHASGVLDTLREAARAHADPVDLAGTPEFPPPSEVVEALRAAAGDARPNRTQDPRGTPAFRRAAAAWLKRRRGVEVDPDREIIATLGTEEGLGHAMQALLTDGDGVLTPTPAGPSHANAAVLAGGEPVPVPIGPGVDFMESLVVASERSERRPRGLLVSFPSYPTGALATPELLQNVVRFAEARDLFILSDAAHAELVLDGPPAPLLLEVPGARDRTLEFVSFAAGYGMSGLGVGFATGNAALVAALARVRSYLGGGPLAASQAAAVVALERCDAVPPRLAALFAARRDALVRLFGAAGWPVPPPAATPYAWAPLPEALRVLGSLEACRRIADEVGVVLAPGALFGPGGDGHVRIALDSEDRLERAAAQLGPWLERQRLEPLRHTPLPRPAVEHA